ncbi:MAG: 4-(cytidine 5'-diphospho)-2-C-methyl-D-erythritol kinase [Pseudomonadota bacterium]
MAKRYTGFAPAKINLALHIKGQRADGYHLLDSLVAFADVGDSIICERADNMSLEVAGPRSAAVPSDSRNLMWKAAEGVGAKLAMTLEKRLPAQAGIGGGSSDAATVLRACEALGFSVPADLAVSLGADVPVCMLAQGARMRGIGEDITPVAFPELNALIVNPGVDVPTGQIFATMQDKNNSPLEDLPKTDWLSWLARQRNDMQTAAIAHAPIIGELLEVLKCKKGVQVARMSGSGATCFALFEQFSEAEDAAQKLQERYSDWWVVASKLT